VFSPTAASSMGRYSVYLLYWYQGIDADAAARRKTGG
jgi:hypothetical protein